MSERMTTAKCKTRGCPDLTLVQGEFGYRCQVTGEIPRHMDGCPKVLSLASTSTRDLVEELIRRDGVHQVLVEPHTPFEVQVDTEEIELPFCEGPCRILVVEE